MNGSFQVHQSDSALRSFLKGLTYRILGTISTAVIAWVVTGRADAALAIGGIELVSKFALYYLHERAWARVPLGTVRRLPTALAEAIHPPSNADGARVRPQAPL